MNDIKNIIEDVNKSEIVSNKVIEKIIEKIGQEEWHELHDEYNDIITTTGEVAISLGSLEELEKENEQLKQQIELLRKMNNEQKETLKKVRVALIQERTANIMNYGKGGVEMFDNMFEILKGVSN